MWNFQNWANFSGFRVVEPFAKDSTLGLTDQILYRYDFTNVLYFSDYFNLDFWTKMTNKNYGIPPLEKWNTFALYPFKKTVVVIFAFDVSPQGVHIDDDINKDQNCVKMKKNFYKQHANLFNRLQIEVVRNVCFVFNAGKPKEYSILLHQFNSIIQNNDSDVHVWFSVWRGFQHDRIPIIDHELLLRTYKDKNKDKIQNMVKISKRILLDSRKYVNDVLNVDFHGYTAVAFRTGNRREVLQVVDKYSRKDVILYFHKCAEDVKHLLLENPSEPKFLSIDLGRFGDMGAAYGFFKVNDDGNKLFKFVLNIVYGNKSIDEYENEIIGAANGIEDSGYIGAMQKTIAENAKHLIVVGGYSNFQASMIMKFKAKNENCPNCIMLICYAGPKRPWQ